MTRQDSPRQSVGVKVIDARKRYGALVALDGVTLSLPSGTVTALVGRNGAGKTTLLNAVSGRVLLDDGSTRLLAGNGQPKKPVIGVVPESLDPERYLRVLDFLLWRVRAIRASHHLAGESDCIAETLGRLGLVIGPRTRFGALSRGQRQLVLWAAALLGPADVLLLDEPLSHLDPIQRRQCLDVLEEERRRGATILFSTHILSDLEDGPAQHVYFLLRGRIRYDCKASSALPSIFQELHELEETPR